MLEKFTRERITQLRLARNVSEYQMSAELGKSSGYIQSITSGRTMPSIEQLFNIIDYFDMTPSEFFDPANRDSQTLRSAIHMLRGLPEESVAALTPLLRHLAETEGAGTGGGDGQEEYILWPKGTGGGAAAPYGEFQRTLTMRGKRGKVP